MSVALIAAASVVFALAFIALGMGISNCYNKRALEKYYEGKGVRPGSRT